MSLSPLSKFDPRLDLDSASPIALQNQVLSNATREVIKGIQSHSTTNSARAKFKKLPTSELEAVLFSATAEAKIAVSKVAMFLDPAWRKRIFEQLDEMHEAESWEPGALPLQEQSFLAFLKAMFLLKPDIRPGLGMSVTGQLVAAWTKGKDQLTLRFIDHNRVRILFNRGEYEDAESGMLETPIEKLPSRMAAIDGAEWIVK